MLAPQKLFTAVATGLLAANESLSPRFSLATKAKDVIPGWTLMARRLMKIYSHFLD